jgi:glutathione peroxidase
MANSKSLYDFQVQTIRGNSTTLESYRGKVLLIVNVASKCGFTPQYEGLQALYLKHKDKGFEILGFPCDQFGGQEPGNEAEIESFCTGRFGVTFPMFAKVEVNGSGTHPLYAHLKSEEKGILGTEGIKWNFTKFLVDRQGHVVKRLAPTTTPEAVEKDLIPLLG